jgi:hypothetical protein
MLESVGLPRQPLRPNETFGHLLLSIRFLGAFAVGDRERIPEIRK